MSPFGAKVKLRICSALVFSLAMVFTFTAVTSSKADTNPSTAIDAANELIDAANAAIDAALAAADAADAATASAQDASDAAAAARSDLSKIPAQIEKLDIAYKNATTALAIATSAFDKSRDLVTQLQVTLNASTSAVEKMRISSTISKLANPVLILRSSISKLTSQAKNIDGSRLSLLAAREQLLTNSNDINVPTPAPVSTPAPALTQEDDPFLADDGEEEEPSITLSVKREKSDKYLIAIVSNLPDENLIVLASKRGAKTIKYSVTTGESGAIQLRTTRNLNGYTLKVVYSGITLDSLLVKV
jgi:chromosome segregation ATPase